MPKNSVLDPALDPREAGPKPPYDFEATKQQPGKDRQLHTPADHGEESYQGFDRLKGRAALITGGDSGIGRAIAIAYAREGADVAIGFLPEEKDDAQETRRWVEQAGRKFLELPGDISQEKQCLSMIDSVFAEFGRLDILVNNAAFQRTHEDVDEWSSEEWDHTFRTNIYAMFYLCKAAIPRMKPGAVILNTASIQSLDPSPHLLAYAASKGAILNFTKGLAQLVIEKGIRVNAVAPGPVWTPLIPSTMPPEKAKNFGKDSAFGRAAQPAELAPAYVFLATNEASFMTGELVSATGGKAPL